MTALTPEQLADTLRVAKDWTDPETGMGTSATAYRVSQALLDQTAKLEAARRLIAELFTFSPEQEAYLSAGAYIQDRDGSAVIREAISAVTGKPAASLPSAPAKTADSVRDGDSCIYSEGLSPKSQNTP